MEPAKYLLPTYGVLTDRQIEVLNNDCHIISYKFGENIFKQERPVSHLFFLKSGLVKIHKQIEEKSEIILDIISPNEFIGITSVFYEDLYPFSATSLDDNEIILVSSNVFMEVLAENGRYAERILNIISKRVIFLMNRMIAMSKKQVPGRLAETLLHFSKNIYKSNDIILPLSRQELADLIQTSKETVSRVLTEFRNDRIIEIAERRITLKSLELLEILNKIG